MSDVRVRFEPEGVVVTVAQGTTLQLAAEEAGVAIDGPCGVGRCGSCRVRASGGVSEPGPAERGALGAVVRSGVRLACLARALGPGEVLVERDARGEVRAELGGLEAALDVEPPATRGIAEGDARPIGAAVDLGTTTIAARLHRLDDGRVLGEAGGPNPQVAYGPDVLTRVSRALAGDADELRRAAARGVADIVARLLASSAAAGGALAEMTLVGNPTMTALLLGGDLTAMGDAARGGAATGPTITSAGAVGMNELADVPLYVPPAVSAFVGADALAGVLATELTSRGAPTLLIDLGTNGEVVLAADGRLLAASAAAGPAFEGAGLSSGMGAEPGAIERVWLDEGLGYSTIADEPARGLCGSGLIDLLAVLLDAGALDESGRLHMSGPLAPRMREDAEGRRVVLSGEVGLTQKDVRAAQLAKAAVQVAVEVVLSEAGLGDDDVGDVLVAGGFGSRARPTALATLGVIPASWVERVTFAGNTALAGAARLLLSSAARRESERIATLTKAVPLAERSDFPARFLDALEFRKVPGNKG